MDLTDHSGLEFVESPVVTVGQLSFDPVAKKNSTWLEGVLEIEYQLKGPENFTAAPVQGTLNYMMCDEKSCRPPAQASSQAKLVFSR